MKQRLLLFLFACASSPRLFAFQEPTPAAQEETPKVAQASEDLNVPYAFYNEFFDFAVGYVYARSGFPQPHSQVIGTAMAGTNGSAMVWGMVQNLEVANSERLFFDGIGQVGYFVNARAYIDGNPDFVGETAGTNDSNEDNFIEGDGFDNYFRTNFKYVLPIGDGAHEIVRHVELDRGLPRGETDLGPWNPFESGRTYAEVRPFYRSQTIDGDDVDNDSKTNGFEFGLFYEHRDYSPSPSQGSSIHLRAAYDFDWFDSSAPWAVYSLEADKYFSLGATETFRQRVIALGFWASDTPSWNDTTVEDGQQVFERPPNYAGSTLGGPFRLRAYPTSRFHDRAAIYYSTELRLVPEWNPLDDSKWVQDHLGVSWWQWVAFAEAGRVAPEWDLSELHTDMKWDAGVGIRALASGITVRVDLAASDEGFGVVMMIGQPFQFGY